MKMSRVNIISSDIEINKHKRKEKSERLEEARNNIIYDIFKGKKIVFTGSMKKTRIEMRELATQYGAVTTENVSRKTDFLVVGNKPGGKLRHAKELGVNIISEKQFCSIIEKRQFYFQLDMFFML